MNMNQIMTVAEVAVMLNDSPAYVVKLMAMANCAPAKIRMARTRSHEKKAEA
jgi:hypothetical protein